MLDWYVNIDWKLVMDGWTRLNQFRSWTTQVCPKANGYNDTRAETMVLTVLSQFS